MSIKERGKFIVIEGPDGVGKTTVIEHLKHKLNNKKVVFLHDPYKRDFITNSIRDLLCNHYDKIDQETAVFLFIAERIELNKIIEKYLSDGIHVICDRYITSMIVINCIDNKELLKEISELHRPDKFPYLSKKISIPVSHEICLINHPDNSIKEPDDNLESTVTAKEISDAYYKRYRCLEFLYKNITMKKYTHIIVDKQKMTIEDTVDRVLEILKLKLPTDCIL